MGAKQLIQPTDHSTDDNCLVEKPPSGPLCVEFSFLCSSRGQSLTTLPKLQERMAFARPLAASSRGVTDAHSWAHGQLQVPWPEHGAWEET